MRKVASRRRGGAECWRDRRTKSVVARATRISNSLRRRAARRRLARERESKWLDREFAGCKFRDARLAKRFRKLIEQTEEAVGESIPLACQDWANTKAAYRFFANDRVSEDDIFAGHFGATGERVAACEGPVLVLHDTTEFSFHREQPDAIGFTRVMNRGRHKTARQRHHKVCGILMHSALAVTTEGLPLGLAAVKFWTRKKFKDDAARRRGDLKRIPIEKKESARWPENLRLASERLGAERCVHVGDREGDIYEFFCAAAEIGTHFLVRSKVDRWAGDGDHTIGDEMAGVRIKGLHRIEVKDEQGNPRQATLEIKYKSIQVLPPLGQQKHRPALTLTVLHAVERDPPKRGKGIDWKLITDLPVRSRDEAIEKLKWYALRWRIEVFHKILKSGCKIEESKLRTADRLVNMIAVFCILSWRIFWMTMVNRSNPTTPPDSALTDLEIRLLDHLVADQTSTPPKGTLSRYLIKIARLGGYLARASDPPPGNKLMWKGYTRLTDIVLGATAGAELVGN
jgi:hypothetical protein